MSVNIVPLAGISARAVRRLIICDFLDLTHERNENVVGPLMIAASIMVTPDEARSDEAFKSILCDRPRCIGTACFSAEFVFCLITEMRKPNAYNNFACAPRGSFRTGAHTSLFRKDKKGRLTAHRRSQSVSVPSPNCRLVFWGEIFSHLLENQLADFSCSIMKQ